MPTLGLHRRPSPLPPPCHTHRFMNHAKGRVLFLLLCGFLMFSLESVLGWVVGSYLCALVPANVYILLKYPDLEKEVRRTAIGVSNDLMIRPQGGAHRHFRDQFKTGFVSVQCSTPLLVVLVRDCRFAPNARLSLFLSRARRLADHRLQEGRHGGRLQLQDGPEARGRRGVNLSRHGAGPSDWANI